VEGTEVSEGFEGLNPPYSTIVADPPWAYDEGWPMSNGQGQRGNKGRKPLGYSSMTLDEMAALRLGLLADGDSHLYLWTTSRYLRDAFDLVEAWGFHPSQTLTWCKPARGIGPGGAFSSTTEFVIFARHGSLKAKARVDSTWWEWSREGHSRKPAAFYDLVEQVSPGPYVELFARQPRLGWDSWGHGYELPAPEDDGSE
jgi:N6-adenosine-specific RNA methylase IME4